MSRHLVLVVDDEVTIRDSLCELLELEGYDTLQAPNGEEALGVLQTHPRRPNLILLDQMMPKMTGEQFLRAIQEQPEFLVVPVILVSAATDAQKIAHRHGVQFLRKPMDADVLLKAIEKSGCEARPGSLTS
jgi:CheY-like chemotaxis protein